MLRYGAICNAVDRQYAHINSWRVAYPGFVRGSKMTNKGVFSLAMHFSKPHSSIGILVVDMLMTLSLELLV